MTTLTLELSPHLLERLTVAAKQRQQPVEDLASSLLSESLTATYAPDDRHQIQQILGEAGLLWESTPPLRAYMDQLENSLGSNEEQEARRRRLRSLHLEPPLSTEIIAMRDSSL